MLAAACAGSQQQTPQNCTAHRAHCIALPLHTRHGRQSNCASSAAGPAAARMPSPCAQLRLKPYFMHKLHSRRTPQRLDCEVVCAGPVATARAGASLWPHHTPARVRARRAFCSRSRPSQGMSRSGTPCSVSSGPTGAELEATTRISLRDRTHMQQLLLLVTLAPHAPLKHPRIQQQL
jgi:hypothetical protein